MLKNLFLAKYFILFMVVGVLPRVATVYHLYWSVYEFDSPVHFIAGASLSLFLYGFFYSGFFNSQNKSLTKFFLISIFWHNVCGSVMGSFSIYFR